MLFLPSSDLLLSLGAALGSSASSVWVISIRLSVVSSLEGANVHVESVKETISSSL